MATRDYVFVTGIETSTQPTATAPSDDNDTINKGYADDTYALRTSWFDRKADIAAVRAIASSELALGTRIFVYGDQTEFWYDTTSAGVDDGINILKPSDITHPAPGRWLLFEGSAGAGGGGAAGIESLEQKLDLEREDVFTTPFSNSVGSGFGGPMPEVTGRLLEDYVSGATSCHVVWNPLYINSADKPTDSATGWAVQGAGATLTTSATKKIGTASLSFDKNGTATRAAIRYDTGALTFAIAGFTGLFFWVNLPSVTNLSNVEVRVDTDGTNYQTFTATTDHAGLAVTSAGVTGWHLMRFDLSTGGAASGTGWDKSKVFRYLHIGLNTSSAGQTYTAILIDSVHFGIQYPERLVQKGSQFSIYDTSNVANFQIDAASTNVQGTITLVASLGANFAGAVTSTVERNTLVISGDGRASMEDGLSGEIADEQCARINTILPEEITNQTVEATFDVNTNMFFVVTSITDSDTIVVEDLADSTANLVSGVVLDTFEVNYDSDGKECLASRSLPLTIASSSHSSGSTTINTGTNTGIAVGDKVILRHLTAGVSCVAKAANENFQSPTLDDIFVSDLGIPYPNASAVWGHYTLSGPSGYKNIKGAGPDLSIAGATPSLTTEFKNGLRSTSGGNTTDYFYIPTTDSRPISAAAAYVNLTTVSTWVYLTAFTGAERWVISRANTGETAGWFMRTASGANQLTIDYGSFTYVLNYAANTWYHLVFQIDSSNSTNGGTKLWSNTVVVGTGSDTVADPATEFRIGYRGINAGNGTIRVADLVFWRNVALTQNQVESIYNRGLHRVLSPRPGIRYRYSQTGMTGQKLSVNGTLSRTTDAASVFLAKMGAIK